MSLNLQPSFAAGELDPSLWSRVDFAKFQTGCKVMKNMIALPQGGFETRPGTKFIGEIEGNGRLIPFEYNEDQTYMLVFTDELLQVVHDEGFVLDGMGPDFYEVASPYAVEDLPLLRYAQSADVLFLTHPGYRPYTLTRTAHDNWVFEAIDFEIHATPPDTVGASPTGSIDTQEITYQVFPVNNAADRDMSATPIITVTVPDPFTGSVTLSWKPGSGTYGGLGLPNFAIYRNGTFYRYTGNGGYGTRTFVDSDQGASGSPPGTASFASAPTHFTAVHNLVGATTRVYKYAVSAVVGNSESAPSDTALGVSDIPWPAGDTVTIGWTPVINAQLYNVYKNSNGQWGWIGAVDMGITLSQPITLVSSPGSSAPYELTVAQHGFTTGDEVQIYGVSGYPAIADPVTYVVTVLDADTFSLDGTSSSGVSAVAQTTASATIATAPALTFIDDNILPDVSYGIRKLPIYDFSLPGQYPAAVAMYQQRLMLARSDNDPTTVWGSRTGSLLDFSISEPAREDDTVTAVPASGKVNEIRHMVPLDGLLIFTAGSEIELRGSDGSLRPNNLEFHFESYLGCPNAPAPAPIDKSVVFPSRHGNRVYDFSFSLEADGYRGKELTALARHVFKDSPLAEWAYQQDPNGIMWCIREDGTLRAITYLPEHEVYAWHRHESTGTFKSVGAISGSEQDDVYFIVQRTVDGDPVFYVEKLMPRVSDGVFVDCSLTYDGSPVTVITGLEHLEGLTVTAQADGDARHNLVVTGGSITLPQAASLVHVGLGYTAQLNSLSIDMQGQNQGKRQKVVSLTLRLLESRGGSIGPNENSLFDITRPLYGASPTDLFTGDIKQVLTAEWANTCGYVIRQTSPYPLTVLGVIPDVDVGT